MADISRIFSEFQDFLNADHEIREEIRSTVREIEQTSREIQICLQPIHQNSCKTETLDESTKSLFARVKELYADLAQKIPENQFYRFSDHWRFVTQKLAFQVGLIAYLKEERLVSRKEVADALGVKVKREDGFHMELDDYLMGMLSLTNELSRLAMNAVTAGDYSRPIRISNFVSELDSGFRLLNLKNDALRKRFDGLKYDVKKCEEIVYDLTIRGLAGKSDGDQ